MLEIGKKKKRKYKPVKFKKRKRMADNVRKRKETAIVEKVEEKQEANLDEQLEDIKFFQKEKQRRRKGLTYRTDLKVTGFHEEVNQVEMIGRTFATEKKQEDILLEQREEFVDKKLREKFEQEGRVVAEEAKKAPLVKQRNLQREMYTLPNCLRMKPTFLPDHEAGERWLQGMSEVQLPVSYTLKNIEETEAAKRALLTKSLSGSTEKSTAIPRNYNQDYTTHHVARTKALEWKRQMMEKTYIRNNAKLRRGKT